MTVTNSTLSGNAAFNGGGIYNDGGTATVTVTNSTFSGNAADGNGGGIFNFGGTHVTVTNSTLSGNSADGNGGGIFNFGDTGTLTVTNSTLSGNTAGDDAAAASTLGVARSTLTRSLISGNSATLSGNEIYVRSGTITANAFNVFGHSGQTNADAFFGFTPGASDFNATSSDQNVALANILDTTLANNGGPTETHALVAGSPAIDFGPTADCAAAPVNGLDQRGEPRSVDVPGEGNDGGANLCDTGAYEVQLPPPPAPAPSTRLTARSAPNSTTLYGTGMGSPTRSKMVAKVTIPNANDVTELYGQMAAKEYNGVRYVRFIFGDKTLRASPARHRPGRRRPPSPGGGPT